MKTWSCGVRVIYHNKANILRRYPSSQLPLRLHLQVCTYNARITVQQEMQCNHANPIIALPDLHILLPVSGTYTLRRTNICSRSTYSTDALYARHLPLCISRT